MFRVLTKVPATRLNRHKNGPSRLYKTVKYYSQKKDLCPPKQTKNTSGITYTIGALVFVSGATIVYSKYDPEFRNWLKSVAPFTDDVIRFVCQEDKSFLDYFKGGPEVSDAPKVVKKGKAVTQEPTDYTAPKPVLPKLAEANKPQDDYTEIRIEKKVEGAEDPIVQIVGEVKPAISELPLDIISRLETKIMEDATNAVQQFKKSINAVRNYNSDIEVLVDDSTENLDRTFWEVIQKKGSEKEAAIQTAEKFAIEALQNITKLKKMLTDEGSLIPEGAKERTRHNLQTIQNDIQQAKKDLEKELKSSTLAEKYWKKVKEARTFFSEELQALFPHVDISQKELGIKSSDLDLFVMHAMSKVLYYQKELSKLETISANRLSAALETAAKDGSCEPLTHEQICQQLEKEKRALEAEYKNKCLQLRNKSESELRSQLKRQSEAFSDHMEDAVRLRELELERTLNRKFDEQLTDERCRYKMEVSAMVGRLRGLEEAMKVRSETDKTAKNAQVLWSACQALFKAVKSACPGFTGPDNIRPLKPEISAIKTAAAEHDELVNVVLAGIPDEAKERGVFPEDALKQRFNNVEKIAKRLALLSEKGGGLHSYLLSMLQSFLLLNATNPISQAELNDEQVDFTKLSTNEILQRARYWMDKGDFAQTLKYMNLLKGAPRAVARQWMNETRILLETQQAANTLMAYAAAASLL